MSCLVVYDQLFYFLNTFYLMLGKGGLKQKKPCIIHNSLLLSAVLELAAVTL